MQCGFRQSRSTGDLLTEMVTHAEAIENLRTNRKTVWRPSQKLKGVASTPLTGRELTLGWTNVWS